MTLAQREAPCCIYCLSEAGPFTSEEHIVPESLGNQAAMLPIGCVCDPCNHGVLSRLDAQLQDFGPLKLLRVEHVGRSKSGKYQEARMPTFTLKRVGPGQVVLCPHENMPAREKAALARGESVSLQVGSIDGDSIRGLARSVFKIGLGFLALDCGHAAALEERFEPARRFVLGAEGIDAALVMRTRCEARPGIEIVLDPQRLSQRLNLFGWELWHSLVPIGPIGPSAQAFRDNLIEDTEQGLLCCWLGDGGDNREGQPGGSVERRSPGLR